MKRRQYRTLLYNGLKNIADQQETNEEWENINSSIRICKRNSSITWRVSKERMVGWSVDKPLKKRI